MVILAWLAASVLAGPGAPQPRLKVSVRSASAPAIVLRANKSHAVPLADINEKLPQDAALELDQTTRAKLARVVRAPDALYLVLTLTSSSGAGNPMGRCGAGTEVSLLWLALTPDFHVRQAQARLIESCWHDLLPDPCPLMEPPADGGTDACAFSAAGKPQPTLTFDPTHPERGFDAR